jgi:hypothetical protein
MAKYARKMNDDPSIRKTWSPFFSLRGAAAVDMGFCVCMASPSPYHPVPGAESLLGWDGRVDRCPIKCSSGVIARLDPKSGLPDFGIKLSKSETSDFDAIQYPRSVVTGSPGQAGR